MTAPPFTLTNAASPLTIPTYDGSGQAVHPSILKWLRDRVYCPLPEPYCYLMALTPYPNGNSTFENPSILLSEDGQAWIDPKDLGHDINPIEPVPSRGYNADPTIGYKDGRLYLTFGLMAAGGASGGYGRESENLWDWTPKKKLKFTPNIHFHIVDDLFYYTSADGTNIHVYDGSSDFYVAGKRHNMIVKNKTVSYWHHEIRRLSNGEWWGLACDRASPRRLWFLESLDYYNWEQYHPHVLVGSDGTKWDADGIYKSSFLVEGGKIKVWYSAYRGKIWHFGYTESEVEGLDLDVYSDNVIGGYCARAPYTSGGTVIFEIKREVIEK